MFPRKLFVPTTVLPLCRNGGKLLSTLAFRPNVHEIDTMTGPDDRTLGATADVIDALLWLCHLSAEQAERELIAKKVAKRTAKNLFAHSGTPISDTLKTVAELFNEASGKMLQLSGADLRHPPVMLRQLVERHKAAMRTRADLDAACAVFLSQDEAIDALKERVKKGLSLENCTVYVVSFTLHTLLPAVRWLCDQGVAKVRLFAGLESTALMLKSKRQVGLMMEQERHIQADFEPERAKGILPPVLRLPTAPTFHGYFVPDVVVCVSPFVWYPTFNAWKGSPKLEDMRTQMRVAGVTPPMLPEDDYTLNGYQQCHFQAFHEPNGDNAQFDKMAKKFKLYLDAHELQQRLDDEGKADKAKPAE